MSGLVEFSSTELFIGLRQSYTSSIYFISQLATIIYGLLDLFKSLFNFLKVIPGLLIKVVYSVNYTGLSYCQDIFGISTMSLLVFRIPIIIWATLYGFLGCYETFYYGYDLPTDFLYYLATNIFVSNICLHLGISDICGLSLSNPYLSWLINSLIIRFWICIYSRLSFCLLGIHISRTLLFVAWGLSIGLLAAWAFLWPTRSLIY